MVSSVFYIKGAHPLKMRKNDKICVFPKTSFSNVKFIVDSESEEIILIALFCFEIYTFL